MYNKIKSIKIIKIKYMINKYNLLKVYIVVKYNSK